jgi:hypothetical protein
MGTIGYGYGSEWHLLRYLGYHHHTLNEAIENTIRNDAVGKNVKVLGWKEIEFQDRPNHSLHRDKEWIGISFLPSDLLIHQKWEEFWPQTGNQQNWDAVGYVQIDSEKEILLVEAKANVEELNSECGAKPQGGLQKIKNALNGAKKYYNIVESIDWLKPYYQYANRLAALYFLNTHNISARLIFIYFMGDYYPGKICPQDENEWRNRLKDMYDKLGLKRNLPKVHNIFLPV